MDLLSKVLLYLEKRHVLSNMKERCEIFLRDILLEAEYKFPPLRYLLDIDVMDLLDFSPELGSLLLAEPLKYQRFCNEILYACLKSAEIECIENIHPSQVAVCLRLKNVSKLMVEINPRIYRGLVSYQGLLLEISKPTPYVYHTVWSCPEQCDGNEVILQYIPKMPPKCHICKSTLYENSGLRRCGEQVTAIFKLRNNLLQKQFKIVDDMISQLTPGFLYTINVVILKKSAEVWYLEQIIPRSLPVLSTIPRDIQELFDACDGLPWQFIYCVASTIGANVCPLNCFMHLKINLLMSLTSVKANLLTSSNIMHVLVAGFDTRPVREIMVEATKLSNISFTLGTSKTDVSTALIGSSGGVCVMPLPLHSYSQKITSAILSTIESGEISHNFGKTKLKCAVWAQGMDFKKIVLYNVASVFGTVSRGDQGEYEDEVAEYLLQRAIDPSDTNYEELQAIKDVAQYIDVVAGIQVGLESSTEKLLRNYFLAARKERTRSVSVGSMDSLVAACLTSARLCRRSTANIEDAVFAIWLHVSGSPEPRFAPDEYLQTPADIKQLKKIIYQFKNWLEEFTGCYGFYKS